MTHSIAQASASSGLTIDTLRYYERIGLIDPPARDSGGRRCYSDEDLGWLHFLTRMRTTGMPLQLLGEYAALRKDGERSAGRRKRILAEHRAAVAQHIRELQACLEIIDFKIENYALIEHDLEATA